MSLKGLNIPHVTPWFLARLNRNFQEIKSRADTKSTNTHHNPLPTPESPSLTDFEYPLSITMDRALDEIVSERQVSH